MATLREEDEAALSEMMSSYGGEFILKAIAEEYRNYGTDGEPVEIGYWNDHAKIVEEAILKIQERKKRGMV
jgi:hypothetical protein